MHRCPNRACPSRGLETLIHWVSAAMDIEGVGEQFVRKLWDEGLLRSMPDLYRLTVEQLVEIEGYGEISARVPSTRSRARRSSRSRASSSVSTSRRSAGCWRATSPATSARSTRIMAASQEDVEQVEGFGPDRAELVAEWFADEDNRRLVEELRSLGLTFTSGEAEKPVEGPLSGRQYVITGHARGVLARGGEGGARGARRQGVGLGLEEDGRRDRGGEPRHEAREGPEGRGAGAHRGRPASRCSAQRESAGLAGRAAIRRAG